MLYDVASVGPEIRPQLGPGQKTDTLRAVTQEFEAIFLEMILRQSRSASQALSGSSRSMARDIYEGWQDQQTARSMAAGRGMSLGEKLYRQLGR